MSEEKTRVEIFEIEHAKYLKIMSVAKKKIRDALILPHTETRQIKLVNFVDNKLDEMCHLYSTGYSTEEIFSIIDTEYKMSNYVNWYEKLNKVEGVNPFETIKQYSQNIDEIKSLAYLKYNAEYLGKTAVLKKAAMDLKEVMKRIDKEIVELPKKTKEELTTIVMPEEEKLRGRAKKVARKLTDEMEKNALQDFKYTAKVDKLIKQFKPKKARLSDIIKKAQSKDD